MKKHSAKFNKTMWIKTIVVAVVLISVELIAGFSLYHNAVTSAYDGTFRQYAASLSGIERELNEIFSEDVGNFDEEDGFALSGSLDAAGAEIEIGGQSYAVQSQTIAHNLQERPVFFYSLRDMCKGIGDETLYTVYTKSVNGETALRLRPFEESVKQLSMAGFEGIALASGSGRVVFATGVFDGYFQDYGFELQPSEASSVRIVNEGEGHYACSVRVLGATGYYLGAFVDFTGQQKISDSLAREIAVILIVTGAVVGVLFLLYSFWVGLNENSFRYSYRIVTDADGKIIRANAKFKQDFPQTVEIKENVARFDEKTFNAVKISAFGAERLLACVAKKQTNGRIRLSASELALPYESDLENKDLMKNVYDVFTAKGGRVLIGTIFIGNLANFKAMFGTEFAQKVYAKIFAKTEQEFTYAYEIDDSHVGILYPEGKKLDNLLQDIKDAVNFIDQPVMIDSNLVNIGAKFGFAVCDAVMERRDFEYAAIAADAALKRAAEDKMNDYFIYHESQKKQYAKFFVQYDIRKMLDDGDFYMEYQPQYSLKENRITGFEALFRVRNPKMNMSAYEIISYAERTGNMVMLGDFVFDTSMRFAKIIEGRGVTVSLNVSPIQLMQAGFVENFLKIYHKYDLKAGTISVEITESFLMHTFDETLKKLQILCEQGISIHLDDFGTQYSSLLYLKKLPIAAIKIDREFISDIAANEYSRAITRMVLNITKELKLLSISEGIETKEQLQILQEMGCDVIQGYLIGRSVKEDAALEMLRNFKPEI